jgi:erythromycin esterase
MNKKIRTGYFTGIILVLLTAGFTWHCQTANTDITNQTTAPLTEQQKMLIAELNGLIYPISGSSYTLPDSELSALDFLKDARIVGMGEATHHTKEFFQMKHRLFKYLVEHHGFKVLAMEADFAESVQFDHYITTGEGDLDGLIIGLMLFWTWKAQEVKDMVIWMREYNKDKPEEEMIRYIGIDCQNLRYHAEWLRRYFGIVDPAYLDTVRPLLDRIYELEYSYWNMSQEEWDLAQSDLTGLYDDYVAKEESYTALSSQWRFKIGKQAIHTMIQAHRVIFESAGRQFLGARDKYMAENTQWIFDLTGDNTKIAIWAHNGHVAADPDYSGGTFSMGKHLRETLGQDYQSVGFSFAGGTFISRLRESDGSLGDLQQFSLPPRPELDSVNYIFYLAQYENFIFPMHSMAPDSPLRDWLSQPRPFISLGSITSGNREYMYRYRVVAELFDIIIHFDYTNAAQHLGPLN